MLMTTPDVSILSPADQWTYWRTVHDMHLATVGTAESSRALHARTLEAFAVHARTVAPFAVSPADVLAYLGHQSTAPTTWRTRRATLRTFYAWALEHGHVSTNPVTAVPSVRPLVLNPDAPAAPKPSGPKRLPVPAAWSEPLAAYDRYLIIQARPATTRRTRREHLSHTARALTADPFTVTRDDLIDYLSAGRLAQETLRLRRATLVDFYAWAVGADRLDTSPAKNLPRVASVAGLPRPVPEPALTEALEGADKAQRLILRLASEAGLRRAEIARTHSTDLMHTTGGWALLVHGKGGRERLVPLSENLADELLRLPAGYAFPTRTGGHRDPRIIARMVSGLLPAPFTLHTLRHRFATAAYRLTHDLYAVQHLLGHSSPAVTQRYVGLDTENLRTVVDAVAGLSEAPSPQ